MVYYGKFEHQDTSTLPHRDNTYNYEQFVLPEWRDFCDLTNRTGGPRCLLKQYRQVEENKLSHIGDRIQIYFTKLNVLLTLG